MRRCRLRALGRSPWSTRPGRAQAVIRVLPDRLDDGRTGAEPRTWPDSNVQAGRRLERTADRKQGTPKLHEPKGPV